MAQKQRTRRDRIISLCAWTIMLALGVVEIARTHGGPHFLPLFQIAVALMVLLHEIKELIEEPN